MGNQVLKGIGEDAAVRYLTRQGFRILHRNWRIRMGEIDVVAMEGTTLVFVEVKARADSRFADPALSVGASKQRRLRRLAEAYLVIERPRFEGCRFDVVSVVGPPPLVRHLRSAF
jgi:putative endonuclease